MRKRLCRVGLQDVTPPPPDMPRGLTACGRVLSRIDRECAHWLPSPPVLQRGANTPSAPSENDGRRNLNAMNTLYGRVLRVLVESKPHEPRRQVQFLKAENEILRSRIKGSVRTTPKERARLIRLGRPLGAAVKSLVTIVSPDTFCRWLRGDAKATKSRGRPKTGRPRTPESIRALVLRLARETDWGYTRIHSELQKLGIRISRRGVANILKEVGAPSSPERSEQTWDEFIKAHARTLWACDFVAKKILTRRGWVDAYLLVFIHIQSRRVHISPATISPPETGLRTRASSSSTWLPASV